MNILYISILMIYLSLRRLSFAVEVDSNSAPNEDYKYHHTSCLNLPDGEHYIRPIPDDTEIANYNGYGYLPSILVRCYSGWTILDYTLDSNVKSYFSSTMQVHDDFMTMDVSKEHLNWDEWFKVENVLFSTSQDCNSCDIDDYDPENIDVIEVSGTGYYMTGNYYGCAFATKALCDMDPDTLECYQCYIHDTSGDQQKHQGLCAHVPLDINNEHVDRQLTPHDKCTTYKWNYLPSLSMVGKWCTCFKPKDDSSDRLVDTLYFDETEGSDDENNDENETCEINNNGRPTKIYELRKSDFMYGTYRIKKCGVYRLMEDIELNMNPAPFDADSDDVGKEKPVDLNKLDDLFWVPSDDQMSDDDQYPSHNFIGSYAMGFFAGISVEADNVIIDLNGYELKMHYDFYLQQRFFSLIELASKPFISGQGPSNFGSTNVHYASNVVIKNGLLGLTSHHGIHGNNNDNVVLRDLVIRDFEVAGVALNGFDSVTAHDIEIGPNFQAVPLTSMYTHARFMMQRLNYIPDRHKKSVVIGEKVVDADDIVISLQKEMNEAWKYAHDHRKEVFEFEKEHLFDWDVDNMFINYDGLPHGGSLYGIFFNSYGAGVFGLGLAPGKSTNLHLKNIKIHDLRSNPIETIRYKLNRGPFNDLLDIKRIIDDDGHYKGTSYSNAQYALNKLVPEDYWSVLGHTFLDDEINAWIEHSDKILDLYAVQHDGTPSIKCNSDVMVHLTKGIFGIRIDNVDKLYINGDIHIENLHNLGEMGESELCGPYYSKKDGGHMEQVYPLQIGYTGTEVHGMSFIGSNGVINNNANIYVGDLLSARGSVYGINFYPNNNIDIHKDAKILISDIHAGAYLSKKTINNFDDILPNTLPRSCAIDVWNNKEHKDLTDDLNTNVNFHGIIRHNYNAKCMTKHDKCSFSYSKIDDQYHDKDILNIDLLNEHIDNKECQLINDDDEFIGLQFSTKDSHQQSLKILALQSNDDKNKKMIASNYISSGAQSNTGKKIEQYIGKYFRTELYLSVITLIIVITIIVTAWKMCMDDNKYTRKTKLINGHEYVVFKGNDENEIENDDKDKKNIYGTSSPLMHHVNSYGVKNDDNIDNQQEEYMK